MRLRNYCPECEKIGKHIFAQEKESEKFGDATLMTLKCGHFLVEQKKRVIFPPESLQSLDGKKQAFEYQKEGIEFIASTGFNTIVADQMGLGKTMQAIKASVLDPEQKCTLVLVRSATIWQWLKEIKTWGSDDKLSGFVVKGTQGWIPPGFRFYVMSMDTFSRFVTVETKLSTDKSYYNSWGAAERTKVTIDDKLLALSIDSIIADECHSFKNQASKRSQALVGFIQETGIKKHVFLSGTPIKNRADEYFVTLNLVDPERFPKIESFRRDWLIMDEKSKWSKVNPYLLDEFQSMLSDFVIRREVNQVQKDLPKFRRSFVDVSIHDEKLKVMYNKELAKLREKVQCTTKFKYWDVRENLMTLRRITGLAKVEFTIDYVDVFLESTENEKIAIGIHHTGVRDLLFKTMKDRGFNPLKISGEDSPDAKERTKLLFQQPQHRVLIISELAGGVGMDGLQVCNNVIVLERQWNSADEEQFEARFHRTGQKLPVIAEYFNAKGTIDEWFSALVEEKREVFKSVVQWSGIDLQSDSESLKDVVGKTIYNKL